MDAFVPVLSQKIRHLLHDHNEAEALGLLAQELFSLSRSLSFLAEILLELYSDFEGSKNFEELLCKFIMEQTDQDDRFDNFVREIFTKRVCGRELVIAISAYYLNLGEIKKAVSPVAVSLSNLLFANRYEEAYAVIERMDNSILKEEIEFEVKLHYFHESQNNEELRKLIIPLEKSIVNAITKKTVVSEKDRHYWIKLFVAVEERYESSHFFAEERLYISLLKKDKKKFFHLLFELLIRSRNMPFVLTLARVACDEFKVDPLSKEIQDLIQDYEATHSEASFLLRLLQPGQSFTSPLFLPKFEKKNFHFFERKKYRRAAHKELTELTPSSTKFETKYQIDWSLQEEQLLDHLSALWLQGHFPKEELFKNLEESDLNNKKDILYFCLSVLIEIKAWSDAIYWSEKVDCLKDLEREELATFLYLKGELYLALKNRTLAYHYYNKVAEIFPSYRLTHLRIKELETT